MTTFKERASKRGVHNVTNLLQAYKDAHPDEAMPVGLSYSPSDRLFSARWSVIRPGFRTDRDNIHHGYRKEFGPVGRDNRNRVLDEAIAWCNERYGDAEWVSAGLYGSTRVPEFVMTWFTQWLKEQS